MQNELCNLFKKIEHDKDKIILIINNSIYNFLVLSGLILGLHPANERRRYFVTTSLTVFKTNGRPVAHGDQKLGWTS